MLRSVDEKKDSKNTQKMDNFGSKSQCNKKEDKYQPNQPTECECSQIEFDFDFLDFLNQSIELSSVEGFDCYIKIKMRFAAIDHENELKRRQDGEVLFSEVSGDELFNLAVVDEYFADDNVFDVFGRKVSVNNPDIAEALRTLPSRKRDVILLYFFIGFKDWEIAELFGLTNSTIAKDRRAALQLLREVMEGRSDG